MKELKTNVMVQAAGHHKFTYEDGKKPTPDTGKRYVFIDDVLHCTYWEDIAAQHGKYVETDEIDCEGGYPVINGHKVKIYGAGEGWVYASDWERDNDVKFIFATGTYEVEKSVSIAHTVKIDKKDASIANDFYMMLK